MKNSGQRPELNSVPDSGTFRNFYYLKAELADFCREKGLPVSGGKAELTERIARFIDTGELPEATKKSRRKNSTGPITKETLIEPDVVCSERLRAFFREQVGKGFSFNTAFQKWLKANAGKTYGDAVGAYYALREAGKQERSAIPGQFEYNAYIRAFFEDNRGKSLNEAIACWKYKKALPGHNRYERSDLAALGE